MLAARMYGKDDIRVEEIERPKIGKNEVLIKVKSAAICGTDIRMLKNGTSAATPLSPLILGHEFSGVIDEAGSDVKGYHDGMRVAVAPNTGCGICGYCVSGNGQLCKDYRAFGIQIDGAFAEYIRITEAAVRQGNITPLKENVPYDLAAINEAFSCVYNGFSRCSLKPGESCLVIGAGAIGVMHAKLALLSGASKVVINDLSEERLKLCKSIDDKFMTFAGSERLPEYINDLTGGKGIDVIIVACPAPQAQIMALELAAVNGRINFFGGLPADRQFVPINSNLIHYKQLIVTGTTRASLSQYRTTMQFISDGFVDLQKLITGRTQLPDIMEGFKLSSQAQGLKNVIVFD